MAKIKLYSTGCPRCKVLVKKLDAINAEYEVITDMDKITKACHILGVDSVPILSISPDGVEKYMDFNSAIKWVGEQNAV